jgi:hypothetical protein
MMTQRPAVLVAGLMDWSRTPSDGSRARRKSRPRDGLPPPDRTRRARDSRLERCCRGSLRGSLVWVGGGSHEATLNAPGWIGGSPPCRLVRSQGKTNRTARRCLVPPGTVMTLSLNSIFHAVGIFSARDLPAAGSTGSRTMWRVTRSRADPGQARAGQHVPLGGPAGLRRGCRDWCMGGVAVA